MIDGEVLNAKVKKDGKEYLLELSRPSRTAKTRIPLTAKQRRIYDFVIDFMEKNLYPPTYKEITKGLKISNLGSIFRVIQALKKKGYIYKDKGTARSIWPIELQGASPKKEV